MRRPIPFTRISCRSMRKRLPSMRKNESDCMRMRRDGAVLMIESMSDEGRGDI